MKMYCQVGEIQMLGLLLTKEEIAADKKARRIPIPLPIFFSANNSPWWLLSVSLGLTIGGLINFIIGALMV